MQHIGLDAHTLRWFNSYLTDRTQQVKLNSACSGSLPVKYGVPQGSILGPTLFSLYINDLIEFVNCDIVFYADDTVILGKNPVLLLENLGTIQHWCNRNLLTINCKKSQWMKTQFFSRTVTDGHCFDIDGMELERVTHYKYLGVLVDSQLTFQSHRDNLTNNVNYKMTFFKKIRKYITTDAALLLYKGTILPILEYADFVFDYGIKYINKRLQTLQNQGLYTVFNQHYLTFELKDSTETLHRRANVIRLDHRRRIHALAFIFGYTRDPEMLDNREIRTRIHDGILFRSIPVEHYKVRQDPMYRVTTLWNTLPAEIRNAENKESLKRMLLQAIPNPYAKIL